jgi:hypothetical protein
MQSRKSREDLVRADLFECLTCNATIRESKPAPDDQCGR